MKKARALQKELSNELLKLEKTQQQQAENEALLKELNNQVVEVKKEVESIQEREDTLRSDIHLLEVEKDDLETNIKMKEQDERERLRPEIKRYEDMINDMRNNIAMSEVSIEKETANNAELNAVILDLEAKKDMQKEKYDSRQADFIKEKDEPVRLGKGNENLKIAVDHLKNDLANLKRDTEQHEKSKEKEDKLASDLSDKLLSNKEEESQKLKMSQNIQNEMTEMNSSFMKLGDKIENVLSKRNRVDINITEVTQKQKKLTKELNRLKLNIDKILKEIKKAENEKNGIEGYNKEQQTQVEVMEKLREES